MSSKSTMSALCICAIFLSSSCAPKPSVININDEALSHAGDSPLSGGFAVKNGRLKFRLQTSGGQTLLSGDINPQSNSLEIGMAKDYDAQEKVRGEGSAF